MFQQAKNSGADVMVTTEKDAVRIPSSLQPRDSILLLCTDGN